MPDAAPCHPRLRFAGQEFAVVGGTALFWPTRSALIVADLHLEKASWFAAGGQMLPPYDSRATLERIDAIVAQTSAASVWCLGDNFHDDGGVARLEPVARERLAALTTRLDWHWITGNHDPGLSGMIGGHVAHEARLGGLTLRHRAESEETGAELSGHYHPKYRATSRGKAVSRACFVRSATRLILPAFGALTGGLSANHPEIIAAAGRGAEALVPTRDRLLAFALTE